MYSRYDLMKTSTVLDPLDQTPYPDPLSIDFNLTVLTKVPTAVALDYTATQKFWVFYQKFYKTTIEGDDLLLILNSIPYLGMLQTGDSLQFPTIEDIQNMKDLNK